MEIRQAVYEDSSGIAKVQIESYLKTYAEIFPAAYLEHFTYEGQKQDWQEWILSKQQPLYVATTEQNEVIRFLSK